MGRLVQKEPRPFANENRQRRRGDAAFGGSFTLSGIGGRKLPGLILGPSQFSVLLRKNAVRQITVLGPFLTIALGHLSGVFPST